MIKHKNITSFLLVFSLLILFLLNCQLSWASNNDFQFSLQRFTYNEGEKSISIGLRNKESSPYLVQASMKWLDEESGVNLLDKKENTPFLITPLLQKIEPDEYYDWIIKFTGTETPLPTDRETVYIAQFRLIPTTNHDKSDIQVTFIRSLNFKIYYRPSALKDLKIKEAAKELTFSVQGNKLLVKNNSPIYLTFNSLKINGSEVDYQELYKSITPLGIQEYVIPIDGKVEKINWQILDEYLFPLDEETEIIN